jgi:Zn-finger nucleic acid-binding protein
MALCLRCGPDTLLVPHSGALGEAACPQCGGRLLDEPSTTALFVDELGLTRAELLDGLPTHERCPACEALRLAFIEVHGTPATICGACGAAWLDAGALSALTHGRVVEVRPTARPEAVSIVSRAVVDGNALAPLFAQAGFRTAADARLIGVGHGLIVERARRVEAEHLLTVLRAAGVEAEIVDAVDVAMPALRAVVQLSLEADAFVVVDKRGHRLEVPYDDVIVTAIGVVRVVKAERGPTKKPAASFVGVMGQTLGRPLLHTVHDVIIERSEGPVVDVVCTNARLRLTTGVLRLPRADGVTEETAFRDLARALFLRLPDRALTPSAHALSSSSLARLSHHAPREWDHVLSWERWRALRTETN